MGAPGERGCELCGARPTVDGPGGRAWCEPHARDYRADPCPSCGGVVIRHRTVSDGPCSGCRDSAWLARLTPEQLEPIDDLIRERSWGRAIMVVRGIDSSLGLGDAQSIVWARKRTLGVSTDPPLPSVDELIAHAEAFEPAPVVIEAVWDGDTIHDWFVRLVAMMPTPDGLAERGLATITSESGRISARATEIGQAIAAQLGVPFHFGSPDAPDDRAPRWSPRAP